MLKQLANSITPARLALALFVAVLLLWGGWLFWGAKLALKVVGPSEVGPLGQLGDLFGGINAMFAAFAFAGVAVAAYYQHLSWKLLSLEAKRSEARHARESFEPLFFQLLSHLPPFPETLIWPTDLDVGSIGHRPTNIPSEHAAERMRHTLQTSTRYAAVLLGDRSFLSSLLESYAVFYRSNEAALGPYWRSLYHVFKLIDRAALSEGERVEYANIARARLGTDEVFFLTLNCANTAGNAFKPLVEEYGLLKHVYRTGQPDLASPDENFAMWCYAPTATMSHAERSTFWASRPDEDPRRTARQAQ